MTARVKDSLQLAAKLERLWADDRFLEGRASRTRDFINAWLVTRYSISDHDAAFKETLRRTGLDQYQGWWLLVSEDAPRYEWRHPNKARGCAAPKTRGPNAGQPCDRFPSISFRVTDPATGEWTIQGWCRQHEQLSGPVRARERSLANVPEPVPNTGGLLPCYIRANNWPDVYVWARNGWKPPFVGIVADDWPVMAKAAAAPVTRLSLKAIDGGRDTQPDAVTLWSAGDRADTPPPALRLVTP